MGVSCHQAHMTGRNWGFLLQLAIFSMNGVLMWGMKDETSSERSCQGRSRASAL